MSFDVNRIAELAALELHPEEKEKFTQGMENILHFVETISKLDLGDYQPYIRSYDLPTIMREDEVGETLSVTELEKNVPKLDESFIIVPQVIKK